MVLRLVTVHSCAYQRQFSRANVKVAFLPGHEYREFKKSFFLPGGRGGLFPATSFPSFLPLQPWLITTGNFSAKLLATVSTSGQGLVPAENHGSDSPHAPAAGGGFARPGEGPAQPCRPPMPHTAISAPALLQEVLRSPLSGPPCTPQQSPWAPFPIHG